MKAKEIIKNVCIYLGKEELLSSSFFEENGNELSPINQKDLDLMLKCLNMITEEISMEYLPLTKTKQVQLVNGAINVYDIDPSIQEVLSVKSMAGRTLRYSIIANKLICLASKVEVTYKVYPDEIDINGNAESFDGKLSARVLAYGVASEYCFLQMLYDDAALWESRFKNALMVASRKKGELRLKVKGWL